VKKLLLRDPWIIPASLALMIPICGIISSLFILNLLDPDVTEIVVALARSKGNRAEAVNQGGVRA
jgi:hypothetical protein